MSTRRGITGLAVLLMMSMLTPVADAGEAPPDFSGAWQILSPNGPGGGAPITAMGAGPPPMVLALMPKYRPETVAKLRAAAGPPRDRGYCAPPRFAGPMGYVVVPVANVPMGFEILASTDRLTILDEMGLIRRLYLRNTPPPDALDQSNGGTSIAHLEGRTLVVQTTGLHPEANTIQGVAGTALGRNARILERMTLVEPDVLEIVTTVTAPELYTAPVTSTHRYRRDRGRLLLELNACEGQDRAYDAATGQERFDATPPADLPPPPK
jgi:hypothetical protein